MTGRLTQLGRQLRKLRHTAGATPAESAVTTLRRAIQLACDLVREKAEQDEAASAFRALAERGFLTPDLASRLAGYAEDVTAASESSEPLVVGGDLDRFLRSLEAEALAPALPFTPLAKGERTRADSTAAVTLSGRVLELVVCGGTATIQLDGHELAILDESGARAGSFGLLQAPTSKPEVAYAPSGEARVIWTPEQLVVTVTPDFAGARIGSR